MVSLLYIFRIGSLRLRPSTPIILSDMEWVNLINWNQSANIRIPALEEQHRELLQLLITLTDSINRGRSREAQNTVLLRFVDSALHHFRKEADLIAEYGYPEYLRQYEEEHARLTRELDDLSQSAQKPDFLLDTKIFLLLKDLLQTHIFSDEKYLVRRADKT
jgi:hemerythrin